MCLHWKLCPDLAVELRGAERLLLSLPRNHKNLRQHFDDPCRESLVFFGAALTNAPLAQISLLKTHEIYQPNQS